LPQQGGRVTAAGPDLKKVKRYLIGVITRDLEGNLPDESQRERVAALLKAAYDKTGLKLTPALQAQLFKEILNDVLGYGPIQPLLDDPDVSEIMVNGPSKVYVERHGKLDILLSKAQQISLMPLLLLMLY
jgi:pilus assembly protein CpaF